MKNVVYAVIASLLLSPLAQNAFADKRDSLNDELSDAKKEQRQISQQLAKCRADNGRGESECNTCDQQIRDWKSRHPNEDKWTPADQAWIADNEARCQEAHRKWDGARNSCEGLAQQEQDKKDEIKQLKRRIDRLDEGDKDKNVDCVDCAKEKEKYKGKSGWESFADIIRAATPLGLGAMGLYGGIKAMNLQSSDYQMYANMMNANGLPFAPPSVNGYGGILGAAMGPAWMASFLMNGNGMGGCCMMGMPGMGFGMGGGLGLGGGLGMMGGYPGMGMMGYPGGMAGAIVGGFAGAIAGGYPGMGMMGMGGYPGGMMGMGGYPGGMMGMGGYPGAFAGAIVGGIAGAIAGGYPGMGMMGYPGGMMGMGGYPGAMVGYGGMGFPGGMAGGYPGGMLGYTGGMGGYPGGMMGYGGYPGGMMGYPGGMAGAIVGGIVGAISGGYPGGFPGGMMAAGGYPGGFPGGMMAAGGYPGGFPGGYPGGSMVGMNPGFCGYNGGIPGGMAPYPYPGMPVGGFPGGGFPGGGYGPGFPGGGGYGPGFPGNPYPYANPWAGSGMNPGCMGGMCNYNPWFSNMNGQFNAGGMPAFYQNQQAQYAGYLRQQQQQAITSQDAQAAQMALYGAQTRYQQVMGNMYGSYYGAGSGYGGGYGGGYYGGGGGGYYGGGGYGGYGGGFGGYYGPSINNPPANNGTRM